MKSTKAKRIMCLMLTLLAVVSAFGAVPARADDQPGPGYSCAETQQIGTDSDFRVALSYCSYPHFNVSETENGDPASAKSMQIAQGHGSYTITFITGVTTPNIRFLALETNLYKGTKQKLEANTVTITDIHGVSVNYIVKNSIWTHKNGDDKAPYSLIIRNPNYFYPDASGEPTDKPVDAFNGETIEIKALSRISLNFTVTSGSDGSPDSILTDSGKLPTIKQIIARSITAYDNGILKTSVAVSWAKNAAAQSYEVYRSTDGKKYSLLQTVTSPFCTDTKTVPDTKYCYRVRAYGNIDGRLYMSEFSETAIINTSKKLMTPSISAKKSGSKVKITIKKADGNKVQVQYKKGSSWKSLKAVALKKTITCKVSGKSVRVRTSIKTGGKTYTSSWSKAVKI